MHWGGPLGGTAGKILANALGAATSTPTGVSDVIISHNTDAEFIAAAAREAESEWLAALAAVGKAQVEEVGQTRRAEIFSDDPLQRWWRPVYALEFSLLECPLFAITLLNALWSGHEAGINGFANLTSADGYFGDRFGVLGIYVNGRSREKQACATGQVQPFVVRQVTKALLKKT